MATMPQQENERATWAAARARLDSFRPQASFIEQERARDGSIAAVTTIFLTNRECPWRCVYCDLWKNTTTETVPRGAIPAQIDFALSQISNNLCGGQLAQHIKLYNAGSFFDPKAIPPEDFPAIAESVQSFTHVIVESHPALIGDATLRFHDLLRHRGQTLEVAMGLEVADDPLLEKMNKRMTLALFRHAAEFLRSHGIALRVFVIVKPPFVRTDAEAELLARRSTDFAFDCGATAVSLIPGRFGPAALNDLALAGEFAPPQLETIETALDYAVGLQRGRVFADLWDIEKLGGCPCCTKRRIARLQEINFNQCPQPRISCAQCATKTECGAENSRLEP
jgi:archaeosine synthase beta-subunit